MAFEALHAQIKTLDVVKETAFDVAEMRTLISRFAGKRADHVVFDIHSKHHNLYTLGTVILHIL